MGQTFADLAGSFADSSSMLIMLLVFLAAGTLAFALMAFVRVRGAMKRRTSRIMEDENGRNPKRSLRYSGLKAVARLLEYTTKHYSGGDEKDMRLLRQRLIQAGIYDPRGVAFFFIARTALAVLLVIRPMSGSGHWLIAIVGGIAGYIGPSMYLDKRIKKRTVEHRSGFPDFMDLLVVCADSGLSMEDAH